MHCKALAEENYVDLWCHEELTERVETLLLDRDIFDHVAEMKKRVDSFRLRHVHF